MSERGKTWRINLAVRRSATMPAPSRLIMLVLSDIADKGTAETPPNHTPSLAQLAAETGQSLATVKRHLGDLEAEGWVERIRPSDAERVRRVRTRYRLHVPALGSDGAESDTALSDTEHGSQGAIDETTGLSVTPDTALSDTEHGSQGAIHKEDALDVLDAHSSSTAGAADGASGSTRRTKKPDPLARFDDFWRVYPLKRGKPAAQKAFAKAVTGGADPQAIIDGAIVYALECRTKEARYIKYPQGWLNDGRWGDEAEHTPAPTGPVQTCRIHRLEYPCRGCAADSKAAPDEDWPPPDDVEWPPEAYEPDDEYPI